MLNRHLLAIVLFALSPSLHAEVSTADVDKINQFCVTFKQDLLKSTGEINQESVSKPVYIFFGETLADTVKVKQLFERLRTKLGAESCQL